MLREHHTHAKRVVLEKLRMFIGILFELSETIKRYLRYRDQLSCIAYLDEHILHDIGLSRSELSAAAWSRAAGTAAR